MDTESVISELRALNIAYIKNDIGANPGMLPSHFEKYLGYATLLYNHFAEVVSKLENREAEILKEENEQRAEFNKTVEKSTDRISATEVEQRVNVRVSKLKAEKKRLEQIVKGATIHINGCQSLMKNYGDEAKGLK